MNHLPSKTHLPFLTLFCLALLALTAGVSQANQPTANPAGAPQIDLLPFAQGLNLPVAVTHAGDDRLFVVQQDGYIRIIEANGDLLPDPFLDIQDRIAYGGEQGLLGLAFHPDYATNGYFYVNYTNTTGDTHISRFQVTADPNIADPNSETILLEVDQPFNNHNGGDVHFGPDGYLYISLGDGGSGGDPFNNAQRLDTLLGKILRIDVDGGQPYAIPHDNPFAHDNNPNTRDEIWVYGLRNPWRFSFDRLTGDMYIGDVGQNAQEEVNFQPADSPGGENYGWSCYEGNLIYAIGGCRLTFLPFAQSDDGGPALPGGNGWVYVPPIFAYPQPNNNRPDGCNVVTGGYVYRGSAYPDLSGYYIFGDFCSGQFYLLEQIAAGQWQPLPQGYFPVSASAFGQNANGELFVADYNGSLLQVAVPATQSEP